MLRLKYRLDRKVNPESDLMQLLIGLTREELQVIRKNWDFKGISHICPSWLTSSFKNS